MPCGRSRPWPDNSAYGLACRHGNEARKAHVDPDGTDRALEGGHVDLDLEADEPLAVRAGEHGGTNLCTLRDRPVPLHLDLTGDAGDPEPLALADRQDVTDAELGAQLLRNVRQRGKCSSAKDRISASVRADLLAKTQRSNRLGRALDITI
jgi:hypothetical protein